MLLPNIIQSLSTSGQHRSLFLALNATALLLAITAAITRWGRSYESKLRKITPTIRTPVSAGQNQHGSAKWLDKTRLAKVFQTAHINSQNQIKTKSSGIVLGMKKQLHKEKIYYVDDDVHTLCIGATRSGKSRTVVLQSIYRI